MTTRYIIRILFFIRTHLAYIANAKKSVKSDQMLHSNDVRWCNVNLTLKDVKITCKRLRNSTSFGGISSV